ncbi:MAG: ribosomal RNA small subunit methyltransferase A [Bdellovibrionaceae bacterium]|nr:ribosomal RNA small subunit methyltransferase A [Bdellovibrio sp.]
MNEIRIFAKKSLGQNFLISDGVITKIIAATESFQAEKIVEIGPGCGALTDLLRVKYKDIILIELDRDLIEFWKNENMQVIAGDALRIDWNFAKGRLLVSNLPYQISSSIVIDRSLEKEMLIGMVLMFQKEVAQRIRANCQTEHYGMLSVIAQEFWTMETVCEAGPRDFKPAPKIASRVLKFTPRESTVQDRKKYLSFVKACFKQRRRVLSTNISSLDEHFDRSRLPAWSLEHKKSDKVRAEELSPTELNSLYHYLKV